MDVIYVKWYSLLKAKESNIAHTLFIYQLNISISRSIVLLVREYTLLCQRNKKKFNLI